MKKFLTLCIACMVFVFADEARANAPYVENIVGRIKKEIKSTQCKGINANCKQVIYSTRCGSKRCKYKVTLIVGDGADTIAVENSDSVVFARKGGGGRWHVVAGSFKNGYLMKFIQNIEGTDDQNIWQAIFNMEVKKIALMLNRLDKNKKREIKKRNAWEA